jgi:hypothetical protein
LPFPLLLQRCGHRPHLLSLHLAGLGWPYRECALPFFFITISSPATSGVKFTLLSSSSSSPHGPHRVCSWLAFIYLHHFHIPHIKSLQTCLNPESRRVEKEEASLG